ncbi:MAG: class I SAM-dependent methyltransferase family protein [Acidilobaceae archaeon]
MTRGRLLKKIALEVLGDKGKSLWSRIDIVGDIAIIKKPISTSLAYDDFKLLGEALLSRLGSIKSIWLAVTPVTGPYKVREYIHLAGEPRSTTIYREHSCSFKVDIGKVFITPRLGFEHLRVAKLVESSEVVVNMFAGIGIFSIVIAKIAKPKAVHSIDINVDAYNLMVENIKINRVEGIVIPYLGDAAKIIEERLVGVADRVLMPLPDLALEYIPYALMSLRESRGVIHVYLHVRSDKEKRFYNKAIMSVRDRVESEGWSLVDAHSRVVRGVGPGLLQVVVDAKVERIR